MNKLKTILVLLLLLPFLFGNANLKESPKTIHNHAHSAQSLIEYTNLTLTTKSKIGVNLSVTDMNKMGINYELLSKIKVYQNGMFLFQINFSQIDSVTGGFKYKAKTGNTFYGLDLFKYTNKVGSKYSIEFELFSLTESDGSTIHFHQIASDELNTVYENSSIDFLMGSIASDGLTDEEIQMKIDEAYDKGKDAGHTIGFIEGADSVDVKSEQTSGVIIASVIGVGIVILGLIFVIPYVRNRRTTFE